ncbi:MAG: histidinol-phosphate transaminase [Clostridiales bacterium]|nr:histidinol-phosphate transaminase [Clostridiales bacterium]
MTQFVTDKVARLTPYVAGLQPNEGGWIKLNTNENPFPPSLKVIEALRGVDLADLRLYPNSDSETLCAAIAENLGVRAENVFCGNGSDEVLALAFAAFFEGKSNILMPDISYGFYPVWSEMYSVGAVQVPLREDFTIRVSDYRDANGVVIANPNAPTGIALSLGEIEEIVRANPKGMVVVDEAYLDFGREQSAVALIPDYENLLVVRTFSKSHALAGLRVGYAVGQAQRIEELQRVKHAFNSYPLDRLAQRGAEAAIKDVDYWDETRQRIIAAREWTAQKLRELGYRVLPSQANFLFAEFPKAAEMYVHLRKHKILARYWNKPRICEFLRITIGTEQEMEAFIQCVKSY